MPPQTPEGFRDVLISAIFNPLALLLFAAGLVVFVWGIVEFLAGLSSDSQKKEQGKWHMLYGLIGMFVMLAASAIVRMLQSWVGNLPPHL